MNGHTNMNGHAKAAPPNDITDSAPEKTDYLRWRLLDERGRHTWHYLNTDEEIQAWPQSVVDKYHLGLPTVQPGPSFRLSGNVD